MNILKRFVRICALYAKKKRLKKQLKLYHNTKSNIGLSKTIISDGADITLNAKTKDLAQQTQENITLIVNQCNGDCTRLLEYIKISGTKIYRIINAEKLLKNIGEEEGFIPEKKGFEALYLSFITLNGLKFKTEPMFIFGSSKPDKYLILYGFYKWYSMKSGLAGFDYDIQKKYNKFMKNINKADLSNLPLEDITGLQEAIARDREATDFVLNYEKETEISKKVSQKISKDGSVNI